ncbi:kinase-like domain-containing protein [Pisolithus orientalis]|uniref:kinase-like domain-containing protein n=1 Tax=Pisolithus orientalis TaxID=936130 RepID=UPI002225A6ED|nr:kinase-like domain-containing protein [Pisolithus orientalis]KAI5984986.1 kinase-like domain-containing protein [Pisolithus orientalis]
MEQSSSLSRYHASPRSRILQYLSERASRYSINLDGEIRRTWEGGVLRGGSATIYHGTLLRDGTQVAIKAFRYTLSESEAELKRLFREVHTWSKLHHENIVRMLGISTEFDSTLSIISEWMPLGNAHSYVQNTENDPRPLLEDIASGLYYLHHHELGPIVHGNLNGSNVLISSDRRALLTDFGASTLHSSTFSMSVDAIQQISFRWAAPEVLNDCPASMEAEVWAFGMTALELFTRAIPFHGCGSIKHVIDMLFAGRLPPRPSEESTQFRLTDEWWSICTSCWGRDPSSRPTMQDIIEKVRFAIYPAGAILMSQRPSVEQDCYLPDVPHQQQTMELSPMLRRLSEQASRYSINLDGRISRNLGSSPLRGGTAVVYQGTLIPYDTRVAIKAFRCTLLGSEADLKRIFREVHLWSKLCHENVVPMLGISTEFDSTFSIISEWMSLGNSHAYVQNTEHDPRPLLKDIATGLQYLHSHKLGSVVHGDLKGFNVLVSDERRALLSDFGCSTLDVSNFNMAVDGFRWGSCHWMAPELLGDCPASKESDVWAFGMTALELFTRAVPFPDCHNEANVLGRLVRRELPPRPAEESTQFRLTDAWWDICTSCWRSDPSSRPTMRDIIEGVEAAICQAGPSLTPPEVSASACPISKEAESHQEPQSHEVARSDISTGQASESIDLMKTASESPACATHANMSPLSTEFDMCARPALSTADQSNLVNLEPNNTEDESSPTSSEKTSRPVGSDVAVKFDIGGHIPRS